MEDKYTTAVEALRETLDQYSGSPAEGVAAHAADVFLDHFEDFVGSDVDRKTIAKAIFLATTVLVMTRDNSEEDVLHLVETEEAGASTCDDQECRFDHEELDTSFLGGQIEGMDAMVAAMVGMGLAVADLAPDFDHFDWTKEA